MGTVVSLVDRIVAASPRSVAVRAADGRLTYRDLSARAERLARRLRRTGVRSGDLVGLCVDRSAALVVGALGVVKAGAAYVAIDPMYPDDRIRWMVDDARAAAVVADAGSADRLLDRVPVVSLADGGRLAGGTAGDDVPLPGPPGPADLAYVVYTSGSTGRPKGVLVEHASLANLVAWHRAAFTLEADDRCTQAASPGFDAVVWEIWPALASGAAIHVVPHELRNDPAGLRDWLVAEEITVTFQPTAVAEALIGLSWPHDTALRHMLTGGDALTRRPPPTLGFSLVNNYGLSETAVVATSGVVAPGGADAPAIGRPIAGVTVEIVDGDLRSVEPGEDGELLVGGMAVARGYLDRDALTAERFVDRDGTRWYRTGDRVRRRRAGELEFLGRIDDQLSIRGFRVEPGEVAAALNAHPAIEASVAVGAGAASGERQLVAYLVAAGAGRPERAELAAFAGGFLPEHMIPSRFVWLDELPLTAHGKIDRDALPALSEASRHDGASGRSPATELEAATAAIVAELLGVDSVGLEENFFLIGGHSLLGAQLIARLEDRFDVEISLRHLFDHPTPEEIAAEVERQTAVCSAEAG